MATPRKVMIRLPMMAFFNPPSEPGGGVICVKTASEIPRKPSNKSVARMIASQPRPTATEA
jgi:hypothetical protein